MSYSDVSGDIAIKARSRYAVGPAVFTITSGGVAFGTGGARFLTGGQINVTTAGRFTALLVNRGQDGQPLWPSCPGGNGGNSWIITGIFAVGTYTITNGTVYDASSPNVTITGTEITTLTTSTPYAGGSGGTFFSTVPHAGGNGSTFPSPFDGVLVGGGGGSGRSVVSTSGGYAGTERNGGGTVYGSTAGQSAATDISGCGCGGGGPGGLTVSDLTTRCGTGGRSGCFILPTALVNSITDSTTMISSYAIQTTVPLTNLLDNYCPVYVNPNTSLYSVACVPNIASYFSSYTINGTSIVDSYVVNYGLKKHPFIITGTSGSYSINFYSGWYTIIFNVAGTYTFNPSIELAVDAYVCSAGGNGGASGSNASYYGGSGGSGAPIRGTFTTAAILNCTVDVGGLYKCQRTTLGYIQATNGVNGGDAGASANGLNGSNGQATSFLSGTNPLNVIIPAITSGTVDATSLLTYFGSTGGGYTMYVTGGAIGTIGFGGAGKSTLTTSYGGWNGLVGSSAHSIPQGVGYGAGGGGHIGATTPLAGGTGVSGVIILSFPYTFT